MCYFMLQYFALYRVSVFCKIFTCICSQRENKIIILENTCGAMHADARLHWQHVCKAGKTVELVFVSFVLYEI